MARLPVPGSDEGVWGDVLNEYLSVSHDAGGSLKSGAVDSSSIQDGTITPVKVDSSNSPANGQVLSYNGSEFEWVAAGGSVDWGDIGGTLSNQSDLQTALDAKASSSHTHDAADITAGNLSLARLNDVLAFVDVSTGNEARPANADRVVWIGGATEPTNIATGDVWMQEV